jgi:hypothetical protein
MDKDWIGEKVRYFVGGDVPFRGMEWHRKISGMLE